MNLDLRPLAQTRLDRHGPTNRLDPPDDALRHAEPTRVTGSLEATVLDPGAIVTDAHRDPAVVGLEQHPRPGGVARMALDVGKRLPNGTDHS
jgi:hypothetical protein